MVEDRLRPHLHRSRHRDKCALGDGFFVLSWKYKVSVGIEDLWENHLEPGSDAVGFEWPVPAERIGEVTECQAWAQVAVLVQRRWRAKAVAVHLSDGSVCDGG